MQSWSSAPFKAARPLTRELVLDKLSAFASESNSSHGWRVAQTLQLGRLLDLTLRNVVVHVIGIEARGSDLGCSLSESVERALLRVSQVI